MHWHKIYCLTELVKLLFAGLQYWNQNGYTGSIANELTTTTAAINYVKALAQKIVQNDTSGIRYGTGTQVTNLSTATVAEAGLVAAEFSLITQILTSGTAGVTDLIIPNGITTSTNVNVRNAFALLQANKTYIETEAVAYVDAITYDAYNQVKCARDTGLIVNALAQDLIFGGTTQATFSGVQYWNHGGYVGVIAGELTTTTAAINYVNFLAQKVVLNDLSGVRYQSTATQRIDIPSASPAEQSSIATDFGLILNILSSGTAGVTDLIIPNGIVSSANVNVQSAYANLQANKAYIQAEAVAYVESTKASGYTYDQAKCLRDVGYMIDSISFDLLYGGNLQAIESGVYYYSFNGSSTALPNEQTNAVAAYNYLKAMLPYIITGATIVSPYQTAVSQVTTGTVGTMSEAAIVQSGINIITNIILDGPSIAQAGQPIGLTASTSTNVANAASILLANTAFIEAEIIAYVNSNQNYMYDRVKCARDIGYMVDSVSFDLLYGGNRQAIQSGVYYYGFGNVARAIPDNELKNTLLAYQHLKDIVPYIVEGTPIPLKYQYGLSQSYGSVGTASEAAAVQSTVDIITNIISYGPTGSINKSPIGLTASTNTNVINATALLEANKDFIAAEVVAYVNQTTGFGYNRAKCARDVGYMLDSVSFDLLHGGNRQAIQSGVYYYGFSNTQSAIPNEINQTVAAFEFLKVLSAKVVQNISVTPLQSAVPQIAVSPVSSVAAVNAIEDEVYRIISIIQNGPSVVGVKEPVNLLQNSDATFINAANNLTLNKEFIKAEVIAYINSRLTFQYDKAKCARDVAYMVDSVSFDLLYGGNRQAVQSGVYYWGYSGVSTSLPKEQVASTNAYQYMKTLVSNIVTSTPLAGTYQSAVTQITNLPKATTVESDAILANIDTITTIINGGPASANPPTNIPMVQSNNQFVNNAAALLAANRDFIRAEVIAYVQSTVNSQVFLPFYDKGSNAQLSVIRNFEVLSNIIANGPSVAPSTFAGNGIFVTTGLSKDDVKIAPVVTSVTPLGNNQYQISISESTVGFGDTQTLYFGQTAVYPLLANDVPDRWSERRLNPIGSMGGALIDGGVISDRSPIQSFVFDAYTQLNQGGNGVKVTNNGYAQLVSVFTIFCSNAVTVENGGICSITNSNSNFGDTCLTAKGYGRREFSGYVYNPPVQPYYPNGVFPIGGAVEVYIADPKLRPHIGLVMEVEPPTGYINLQGYPGFLSGSSNIGTLTTGTIEITGIDNTGFVIGQNFYVRDQYGNKTDANNQPYVTPGTIVADVNYQSVTLNYPLNSGGGDPNNANYFNLYTCGNAYYTVLSSTVSADPITPGTFLLPGLQGQAEVDANNYLNSLTQKIIVNQSIIPLQTSTFQVFDPTLNGAGASGYITNEYNLINSILSNGPNSAPTITKSGTIGTGYADAAGLLAKNRTFLQDEIISYVDANFTVFLYDQDKCFRDTGLIVDAIAQDLVFGGTSQSTFAGIQYWNQNGYTGNISSELATTVSAIEYASSLAQLILQNNTSGLRFQSSSTQVTGTGGSTEDVAKVNSEFNLIVNILNNGTSGITDLIVPNSLTLTGSASAQQSASLLQANKSYIQAEVVAYIERIKAAGYTYNQAKCVRDIGYMLDSVSIDLLYGGNRQAVQSGVYYYGYSNSTAIPNESIQVTAAYRFIRSILPNIIQGIPLTTTYQYNVLQTVNASTGTAAIVSVAQSKVDAITNIIVNGPTAASAPTSLGLTQTSDTATLNAGNLLEANRQFIQAETIAYVNTTFGGTYTYNQANCARDTGLIVDALAQDLLFSTSSQATFAGIQYWNQTKYIYNEDKCARDTGLIVDAIALDLLFGSNTQATFSGIQYWNQAGYVGAIANEITTTTAAISYVQSLAAKVLVNDITGPLCFGIQR